MAGSGDGGTYFVCEEAEGERPVLYTDSEGRATLLGADLVEALTLVVALPFWGALAQGFTIAESGSEIRDDRPDFDDQRAGLVRSLALSPLSEEEAAARLRSVAARTVPDYLPHVVGDERSRYEPIFRR
ncbi:hypothetical protein [Pseudonocardia sp. TRM90224]|uniref:hypothetical protein n=1 Tax=Pseudonocardia sp. TRM90224 TaxID=2812678 RepID=UPI001E5A0306|nr:hypothetical protein [Pseudonocardia sp. TRM90224]